MEPLAAPTALGEVVAAAWRHVLGPLPQTALSTLRPYQFTAVLHEVAEAASLRAADRPTVSVAGALSSSREAAEVLRRLAVDSRVSIIPILLRVLC